MVRQVSAFPALIPEFVLGVCDSSSSAALGGWNGDGEILTTHSNYMHFPSAGQLSPLFPSSHSKGCTDYMQL